MTVRDRRGELEVIFSDECLDLLRARDYGRLGVVAAGQPVVLPINYALDGDHVVFRTGGDGDKFDALVRGARAALEIDEIDPATHAGWSVLVTGRVTEVRDRAERERLDRESPLMPWAPGDRSHWMVMSTARVTGRRIGPATASR
jgi:nitroimidazol reductase NimA-like FMN-containing flavoprotein (pyridoxamine 5'-phosphate oxidase superfamily)